MVGVELFLQAPARLKQPIAAVLGDRPTLALTRGVQRAAPLAHPRPTALRTSHELGGIELDAHRPLLVGRRVERLIALAAQLCLGLTQRLAPALSGAQLLGQLVAAPVAVELVLARVDLGRLGQNLARNLPEVAVGVARALAAIFVPSIATTPTNASPARRTARGPRRTRPRGASHASSGTPRSSSDPA